MNRFKEIFSLLDSLKISSEAIAVPKEDKFKKNNPKGAKRAKESEDV